MRPATVALALGVVALAWIAVDVWLLHQGAQAAGLISQFDES